MATDAIRLHERRCDICKRREWCITVMDLIAQKDGYKDWDTRMEAWRYEQKP